MVTFRPLTRSSAAEYFKTDLTRQAKGADASYYLTTGAVPPEWGGKLAATFGLAGPPTQEQVQRLLDGHHPLTGEDLVQRRTKNRRQGYDVVVSAPKSVSVMAMFDDRLPALVREAERLAMLELEANAAVRVRSGKQDRSETTGNLVWLKVEHQESRELDPMLHSHHVIPNFTLAADGSLKALERSIIEFVKDGSGVRPPLATTADLKDLAPEQEDLVKTVIGSRDRVTAIEAPPGAGKSFCLRSISKAIPNAVCCAPTAAAVEVLEGDGIRARTLDSLLNDRKTHAGIGTVIVDEASLVSSAQCAKLLAYAKHHNWRLVLQGDRRQNRAVAAGSPFALILEYTDTTRGELREIRRQRTKPYRRAVKLMARGDMAQGLTALEKMKAVEVSADPDERRQAAARYYADACEWGTVAAVAPTWREITESTRAIRAELRDRGRLSRDETEFTTLQNIDLTVAQRRHLRFWPDDALAFFTRSVGRTPLGTVGQFLGPCRGRKGVYVARTPHLEELGEADLEAVQPVREVKLRLSPGDKLLLQANGACEDGRKLVNGTTAQIESIRDGRITLKDGRTLPPGYRRFSLGYVTTAFSAQGVTANTAMAILPTGAGISRKSVFVALSRGRDEVKLFTDDLFALRAQLDATSAQREHAIEISKPAKPAAPARPRGMGGQTLEAAGQSRPRPQAEPGLDQTSGFGR